MKPYERIRDDELFSMIDRIEKADNDRMTDETVGKDALVCILKTLIDIRQFMRKMYKTTPKSVKTYKKPTGNKSDIITGEK